MLSPALPDRLPIEFQVLIRKLDDACRQAQELSKQLQRAMLDRVRRDQQVLSSGRSDRRRAPRKVR
jgi:hypothetical protein